MSSTTPDDFWDKFHGERPGGELAAIHDERSASVRPRRRRPFRALLRFLLTVGIGVGGTLAWQAYGDTARKMAAAAYPDELGWLMPAAPSRSVAATAPAAATVGAAPPSVATHDQQALAALSLSVADIRRSVEELAARVASSQQQSAASQQQMAGDIERLQASELDIRAKLSAPPPRPPRPAHKPAPLALAPAAAPPAAAAPAAAQ